MLRCLRRYRNNSVHVAGSIIIIAAEPGELMSYDPDTEALLLRDAPGCFEVVLPDPPAPEPEPDVTDEPEAKALDAPPVDKQIKRDAVMTRADHPGLVKPKPRIGMR